MRPDENDSTVNGLQQNRLKARAAVDEYNPSWSSFHHLLEEQSRSVTDYLIWHDEENDEECRWSHDQWAADVSVAASLLFDAGVRQGATVSMLATNRPETLLTAFASWCLGACFMPLDVRDSKDHHIRVSQDIDNLWTVRLDQERSDLPGRSIDLPKYAQLRHLRRSTYREVDSLDVSALRMHTSGTSGPPKPILVSMRALLTNCDAMQQGFGWTPRTRALTVLPISHANGLVISSFLPWYVGATTILLDRFRRRTFWTTAARLEASTCSLVPTVLEYLLISDPHQVQAARSRLLLTEVISGSGPLRPAAAEEFEEQFGIPVRQLYGLSETSAVLTVTPTNSAGRISADFRSSIGTPVAHTSVEIVNEAGQLCHAGERGEIVARGAMLMDEYANRPQATAEAFMNGWFHTGDRGYWLNSDTAERWFFLEGRMREVIHRAGSTILPQTIDEVVASHPGVKHAATIGFPNRWYGEEIAVYIVPQSTLTAEELLKWCEDRLDFEHRPKVVLIGNDIPLTTVGKIRRGTIAKRVSSELEPYWENTFR